MKVIKSKYSLGKVAGAFPIFDQFLWLPLESVEWIWSELKPQQTRLGMDGTETNYLLTFRAPDFTFSWYIVNPEKIQAVTQSPSFLNYWPLVMTLEPITFKTGQLFYPTIYAASFIVVLF